MLLLYLSFLIFLYLSVRLIYPLPARRVVKLLLLLLLFAVSQYHHILRWYFGTLAATELPVPVLLLMSWLFLSLFLFVVFQIVRDAGSLLLALWRIVSRSPRPIFSPLFPRYATAVLCFGAMALAAYAEWQAVRVPDIRKQEVIVSELPSALDGMTIVQISDLHVSPLLNAPRVRAIVDKVNALQADLIVLTGDMIDGRVARRTADVAPLKDLSARYGVFACEGNHEYYSGYQEWTKAFEELGLVVLRNEHKIVTVKGTPLVLAGVTDPTALRFHLPGPDAGKAFSNAPAGLFRVLLAHQPAPAREYASAGADLMLSGHTHGGQIRGFDAIVARKNGGFLRGWYTVDTMRLYVSTGAGLWNAFPARIGVPSEIVCFTLRSAQKKENV